MALTAITAAFLMASAAAPLPSAAAPAFNASAIAFDDGYAPLFGERNIKRSPDGTSVKIVLNQYSGSGFISSDLYYHGLFSASIKLPSDHTAGVVVAFYMSNGDIFERNHDELDFEFLGNVKGMEWKIQTNVYGNGSTSRGREERYRLPFDPTKEPHQYSILWTNATIIFYIDEIPIREVVRRDGMGGDYPAKPMSVYGTIWDGSTWATAGGKHKADYRYAPFESDFSDLVLAGCRLDPIQQFPAERQCGDAEAEIAAAGYSALSAGKRADMRRFRRHHMLYTFCYDGLRYPEAFPDCEVVEAEAEAEADRFRKNGHIKPQLKQPAGRRRRHKRRGMGGGLFGKGQLAVA